MKWETNPIHVCPLCELGLPIEKDLHFARVLRAHKDADATMVHLHYDMCPHCGLVYQYHMPTQDTLNQYYAELYRRGTAEPGMKDRSMEYLRAVSVKNFYEDVVGDKKGQVLDIGSSAGLIGAVFRDDGWIPGGVEPNVAWRKWSQSRGYIVDGWDTLEDLDRKYYRAFDLVTMIHVLEHLTDPIDTLLTVRQLLKDDGHFIVEVPNLYKPVFGTDLLDDALVKRAIMRNNLLQIPHTLAFTRRTFVTLLELAGLRPIAQHPMAHNIRFICKKDRPRYRIRPNHPLFREKLAALRWIYGRYKIARYWIVGSHRAYVEQTPSRVLKVLSKLRAKWYLLFRGLRS